MRACEVERSGEGLSSSKRHHQSSGYPLRDVPPVGQSNRAKCSVPQRPRQGAPTAHSLANGHPTSSHLPQKLPAAGLARRLKQRGRASPCHRPQEGRWPPAAPGGGGAGRRGGDRLGGRRCCGPRRREAEGTMVSGPGDESGEGVGEAGCLSAGRSSGCTGSAADGSEGSLGGQPVVLAGCRATSAK